MKDVAWKYCKLSATSARVLSLLVAIYCIAFFKRYLGKHHTQLNDIFFIFVKWQGIHCSGSRLYDLWFFPIFSFKQTRGGSYHCSYKIDKERVSLSPSLVTQVFFLSRRYSPKKRCLGKKASIKGLVCIKWGLNCRGNKKHVFGKEILFSQRFSVEQAQGPLFTNTQALK